MRWPHFALDISFLHSNSSMIVLKVYLAGIAVRKEECKSPILICLDGPRTGALAF